MPLEMMGKVFGKNGVSIWKKANGIDKSPVVQYHEQNQFLQKELLIRTRPTLTS